MITDTLLDRLVETKTRVNKARDMIDKARTKQERRDAEEELNFWQGKASYYETQLSKSRKEVRQ